MKCKIDDQVYTATIDRAGSYFIDELQTWIKHDQVELIPAVLNDTGVTKTPAQTVPRRTTVKKATE